MKPEIRMCKKSVTEGRNNENRKAREREIDRY